MHFQMMIIKMTPSFKINLKHYIRTLLISTCIACIIVVLFYEGLVEKQLFTADEYVTLNKYISTNNNIVMQPAFAESTHRFSKKMPSARTSSPINSAMASTMRTEIPASTRHG